jgi:hypothetical protein
MGFKSNNKKLQKFKEMTVAQDEEDIINRSWEHFYEDKLNYISTESKIEES